MNTESFMRKLSVFGGEIFIKFEYACFGNELKKKK